MWLFPAEPRLFQTDEKNTEKEKKYNVQCEIATIIVTLAENSVLMKDVIAYSEKLIEKMIFKAF